MALAASFVTQTEEYWQPARTADIYSSGTKRFTLFKNNDGWLFMFKATAPPDPSSANAGLAWTIVDPAGAPQVYNPTSDYIIQYPVTVQSGSIIHVFYILNWSVLSSMKLCHVQFDMSTEEWGVPDETGYDWRYNVPGDYEIPTLVTCGAISATDFIIAVSLFNGTVIGGDYDRTLFMVRKTAGVWATPVQVSATGNAASKTLVIHQSAAVHVEATSDLVHFFWFQNGGNLHAGTYNSSSILRSRSYNIAANTFNAIQDVVTYDNVAAVGGATQLTPNIVPRAVKKSGTIFVAFNPESMSGAAAPAFATISGDPTVASPTYTKTDLTSSSYVYTSVPRLVLNSDGDLYCVAAYFGLAGGGAGYTDASPRLVEYLNTGATTWAAEATLFEVATGTGAYPPTANNVQKSLYEQAFGINSATTYDGRHWVYQISGVRSDASAQFDNIAVIADSTLPNKYAVMFPVEWADELGTDSSNSTFYLRNAASSGPCDPTTINTGCTFLIDGISSPPGTYELDSGSTYSIVCVDGGTTDDGDPPFPDTYPYLFSTDDIYGRDHLSLNLKMVRGDTYKFTATIILNGAPVDLTGGVVTMTAKWALGDSDNNAVFQVSSATSGITVTSPTTGEIAVTIASALTEPLPSRKVELPYDIQFVNTLNEVYTVLYGTLLIVPDATITS